MTSDINWFELRHRLEEAGETKVLHLSQSDILERVGRLPQRTPTADRVDRNVDGPKGSERVAALLALVAKGAWTGKQVITRLEDGSGILICRRDVGKHAHPVRAGGRPVDHWNVEVQRVDPQGREPNKPVLNLHILLDQKGEIVDAYL